MPVTVALVGRPNVGKSTLFNRLVGFRKAVVSPVRGTTRDRMAGAVRWGSRTFTLVDTGGMEAEATGLAAHVQRQIRRAVDLADVVLLVCDARDGLVPADEELLQRLRPSGKPVWLVVNKVDTQAPVPPEFFRLRVPEAFSVSALHGRALGPLLDALIAALPEGDTVPAAAGVPQLAIVGRQNVGKSSLYNALLHEERVIVSDVPGTTRDSIDTPLIVRGRPVVLIDTAGLRHRRKVSEPVDFFSMGRAIDTIGRCDTALLMLDATQGLTRDDLRLLHRVIEAGCGLVILLNKWDLLTRADAEAAPEALAKAVPFAAFAPVLPVSAKTGFQVSKVLPMGLSVVDAIRTPPSTEELETAVAAAFRRHPPPRVRGRGVRLKSVEWLPGHPPALLLRTNPAMLLTPTYTQYLLKQLRGLPRLRGVPVRVRGAAPALSRRR